MSPEKIFKDMQKKTLYKNGRLNGNKWVIFQDKI